MRVSRGLTGTLVILTFVHLAPELSRSTSMTHASEQFSFLVPAVDRQGAPLLFLSNKSLKVTRVAWSKSYIHPKGLRICPIGKPTSSGCFEVIGNVNNEL